MRNGAALFSVPIRVKKTELSLLIYYFVVPDFIAPSEFRLV